jgi:hypothetical protein
MRMPVKTLLAAAMLGIAAQAAAEVTFYDGDAFRGRAFTVDGVVDNFEPTGFNDRARSAVVNGGPWEVCEHAQFQGRCVVLGPGSYDSLNGIGMSKRISSARPAGPAPAPLAAPAQGYYQSPQEPLYQANVTSVRAVEAAGAANAGSSGRQVREDRVRMFPARSWAL